MLNSKIEKLPDVSYPILKSNRKGMVVLFVTKSKGTVVHVGGEAGYSLGDYSPNWCCAEFVVESLPVTLSND